MAAKRAALFPDRSKNERRVMEWAGELDMIEVLLKNR